jgi:hypothetical protein
MTVRIDLDFAVGGPSKTDWQSELEFPRGELSGESPPMIVAAASSVRTRSSFL